MKITPIAKMLLEKAIGVENLERGLFIQAVRTLEKVSPQKAAELAAQRFARPRRWPEPKDEAALASKGTLIEFRCGLFGHKYGSGKPILLVHGWGGRGLQLGTLIDPLVKRGFSVVALDGPAHGRSPGEWTSPTHFATFLKSVNFELGPLKAIVGHSFGSVCTTFAMESGLDVERAVLICPANRYGEIIKNYIDTIGLGAEASHLFYQLVNYRVGISARDFLLSSYFARIKQPVLLIHDKNDKEISHQESESLAKSNSTAKLVLTEGLGHRRILRSDLLIEKVTEFLT